MGRPKLEIDEALVERLASIYCPMKEIAAACNCSVDTLENRFSEVIAKGREKGKITLRRLQWEAANKGNITMLIWLGKQILGQTEKVEQTVNMELAQRAEEFAKLTKGEQIALMKEELKRLELSHAE